MPHSTSTAQSASLPPDGLLGAFRLYGDRTSSLATLGGQFTSHQSADIPDILRVLDTPGARIAASEPLAPPDRRAEALAALAAASPGQRTVAMPVGRKLAAELRQKGFTAWQIGSEPVFRLAQYFAPGQDPLARHPVARALARRGAEVREVDLQALPEAEAQAQREQMRELAALWLADKKCLPLGFLARMEPFAQEPCKRYFTLRVRGELQGFVAAAPVCSQGRSVACYLQDMPRRPDARAGASELLILEVLRLLYTEGLAEARLGMAPLAHLDPEGAGAGLLSLLHRRWRWGYNFRSLSEFKDKFEPTAWEPLYLASTCPSLPTALADALRAHFPEGLLRPFTHLVAGLGGMSLRPEAEAVLAAPAEELAPRSLRELLARIWLTCSLVVLFVGLHLGRLGWPWLDEVFRGSGYVPGNVTWQGVFLGPLFHNHWFHLAGDQLSFLLFGVLIEALLGLRPYLALLAAGLWLSNPLTQAVCWALLSWSAPGAWAATLAEVDYGSSNAVFAMAGALAALLRQGSAVLVPFAIYGLFICLARESWLALHHLLTLGLGYAGLRLWMSARARVRPGAGLPQR
ncbi:MAG: phosphatidylglycerol lysyltransferase domain-containing protein [Humidesulfovibrio sp.]|nr:phosphatidylglycerol lysyltransferase domain-containing protein [Humidesulfovibrio sp.]